MADKINDVTLAEIKGIWCTGSENQNYCRGYVDSCSVQNNENPQRSSFTLQAKSGQSLTLKSLAECFSQAPQFARSFGEPALLTGKEVLAEGQAPQVVSTPAPTSLTPQQIEQVKSDLLKDEIAQLNKEADDMWRAVGAHIPCEAINTVMADYGSDSYTKSTDLASARIRHAKVSEMVEKVAKACEKEAKRELRRKYSPPPPEPKPKHVEPWIRPFSLTHD